RVRIVWADGREVGMKREQRSDRAWVRGLHDEDAVRCKLFVCEPYEREDRAGLEVLDQVGAEDPAERRISKPVQEREPIVQLDGEPLGPTVVDQRRPGVDPDDVDLLGLQQLEKLSAAASDVDDRTRAIDEVRNVPALSRRRGLLRAPERDIEMETV